MLLGSLVRSWLQQTVQPSTQGGGRGGRQGGRGGRGGGRTREAGAGLVGSRVLIKFDNEDKEEGPCFYIGTVKSFNKVTRLQLRLINNSSVDADP